MEPKAITNVLNEHISSVAEKSVAIYWDYVPFKHFLIPKRYYHQ